MLTQTAEYALRASVYLGQQRGMPCTVHQIAEAIQAPNGYLAKVLQAMSKAGIVKSRRGLHGGFVLAAPPEDISVYDVLLAVEALRRIDACPLGQDHGDRRLCPLHQRIDDILGLLELECKAASIADVLASDPDVPPLCRKVDGMQSDTEPMPSARKGVDR